MKNKKIAGEILKIAKNLVGGSWEYTTRWEEHDKTMVVTLEYPFAILVQKTETKEKFLERFNAVVEKINAHGSRMSNKKLPKGVSHIESNGFTLVGNNVLSLEMVVEFDASVEMTEQEAEKIAEKLV